MIMKLGQVCLFVPLVFVIIKASCLPGTSLLKVLDSINENDDAQRIARIIGNEVICCNSSSYHVIERAVILNRAQSLGVILKSTVMMSDLDSASLIESAIYAHALDSLIVMFHQSLPYRRVIHGREQVKMRTALWCGSYSWTAGEIELLSQFQEFYGLIGDYRLLLGIRSPDIACLFCRVQLENNTRSAEAILWFVASNPVRHLGDSGLSQVVSLLLKQPFQTPRNLWIANGLIKKFLEIYSNSFQSLALLLQDPRISVPRMIIRPNSKCSRFIDQCGRLIGLCKSGDNLGLRQTLWEARWSRRAVEILLRSSLRCGVAACLREVLLLISHKLISNNFVVVGLDQYELLSMVKTGFGRMVKLYRLSLQRPTPLPSDIIQFINSWMFNLMLADLYNFKI